MSIRLSKEEMTLMMPTSLSQYAPISPATHADDMAPAGGVFQRLVNAVRWVAELPRRRAVVSELSMLSDHELADIGLNRAELGRVFDPAFQAQRDHARSAASYRSARA